MHLADAFIQSDLQCIQAIHFCQYVCSLGIEPTTFALLTQCSTIEPQKHKMVQNRYMVQNRFENQRTINCIKKKHKKKTFINTTYISFC